MASICCSPPDRRPAGWRRRSPSTGNRVVRRLEVVGDLGVAAAVGTEQQVLLHRRVGEHAAALGHEGDAPSGDLLGGQAVDALAEEA